MASCLAVSRAAGPAPGRGTGPLPGAGWAERKDPGGRGAASSWVPLPFEKARAALIAELERNLDRWAGTGGSDPARYSDALDALKAATGPVSIGLPGHVLSITEAMTRPCGPPHCSAARPDALGRWLPAPAPGTPGGRA